MYIIYYVRAFFFAFIIGLLHSSTHCPKVLQWASNKAAEQRLSANALSSQPWLQSTAAPSKGGRHCIHAQESALLSTSTHCLMNHMPHCSATTGILKAWQMLASISWELKLCPFLLKILKMMLISHSSLADKVKEAPLQPLFSIISAKKVWIRLYNKEHGNLDVMSSWSRCVWYTTEVV